MGAQGIKITFLTQPYFTLSFFKDGESYEGNEGHGSHEGNEGHGEEANLCKARQASCLRRQNHQVQGWVHSNRLQEEQGWKDREQEEERPHQERSWPLDCSSPAGPQSSEHQGLCSYQEGHSTLQEGQGALRPVNALSLRTKSGGASSRCGAIHVCRAPEPSFWILWHR